MNGTHANLDAPRGRNRLAEVFVVALRLGLTSFGGPIAHVGYFRQEYVARREWLDERTLAGLVALCHFLPGPTSSQLGFAIGILRAGIPGGIAAFAGFTLPSAVVMAALGFGLDAFGEFIHAGLIDGLKAVAAAVLVVALLGMTKQLAPDWLRASVACASFFASLVLPQPFGIVAIFAVAAVFGMLTMRQSEDRAPNIARQVKVSNTAAIVALIVFIVLVVGGLIAAAVTQSQMLDYLAGYVRSGVLVFGGGHVVLGLLNDVVVPQGWVSQQEFLAGYGAAQALPGPLFTFAAYLGAVADTHLSGWIGAVTALAAIFVPSLLLVVVLLPRWHRVSSNARAASALMGINASVVGFLAAAMYEHVWLEGLRSISDAAIAVVAFALLAVVGLPPWLVVMLGGVAGYTIGLL